MTSCISVVTHWVLQILNDAPILYHAVTSNARAFKHNYFVYRSHMQGHTFSFRFFMLRVSWHRMFSSSTSRSGVSGCMLCALALSNLQFLYPYRVLLIGELLIFNIGNPSIPAHLTTNPSIPAHLTTNPSIPVHLTISWITTPEYRVRSNYEPLKSSLPKPSRCTSNCILLDNVQLLAPFIPLLYCT